MIADRPTLSIAKAGELVGSHPPHDLQLDRRWQGRVRADGRRFRADLRRYTVARSACRRHPAGYARNLGRRLNTLRGLNVALPRLPAPLRRASPVPWSGAPPQAATGASAPSAPSRCGKRGQQVPPWQTRRPPPAGATVPPPNRRLKRGSSAPGLQMSSPSRTWGPCFTLRALVSIMARSAASGSVGLPSAPRQRDR